MKEEQLKLSEDYQGNNSTLSGEKKSGETTCIFCRIVRQEAPSNIVFRDKTSVAFLDRRPLFPGHCLVVPVEHYETLLELPMKLIEPLFSTVKLLAEAVQIGMKSDGSFVAANNIVSQSVPHLHVHVIPRRFHDGLKGFFWPRQSYSNERSAMEIQETLRKTISDLQLKTRL